jgi:DNA-binding CsgD family transcriptional regulator
MIGRVASVVERLAVGLLERTVELSALSALLDRAVGGEGGLALVEGPAGIGKTSVLEACAEAARERGMTVLRVRGDELVMESSFAAVRELLSREAEGDLSSLQGAARLAAPVFEAEAAGAVDRDRAAAVLHGLYWLVAGVAERGPVLLLVDDAQWLDAASARFVVYLARRLTSLPVLLVVGLRTGERADVVGLDAELGEVAANVLRPAVLSEDASATLVRGALGTRADDELCRSCHEATGGNPFYRRELAIALSADGGRPTVEAARRVRSLGAGAIGRSVLVRLARLGTDCERLTQALVVLGPGCPLRHAATLADLRRDRAEVAADALRAVELLAHGPGLSFAHPIVGEAIGAELASSRRAALHREAARILLAEGAPSDRVAAHLLATEPYGDGWVVDALRAAAQEALARGAPEAAVSYLRRALAEPPAAGSRLEVLVELGRAETHLPIESEYPALREALELADDPARRAQIALELAGALMGVGRYGSASELLDGILQAGDALDPAIVEMIEGYLIGGGSANLAAADRVQARAARHLERARRGEVHDPMMLSALAMGGAPTGLPARETAALARAALADQRLWAYWPALGGATAALTFSEELDEAARMQDLALAEAQRRGSVPMFATLSNFRSWTAFRAGDLDVAEDHGRRGLELTQDPGTYIHCLQWLGAILVERGCAREAAGLLESVELEGDVLHGWHGVVALAGRGVVRAALGDLDRGIADLLDADRRMAAAGLQLSVLTDWVPAATGALVQLGPEGQAQEIAERELAQAIAFGAPRRHGIALSVCGTLDSGEDALYSLRQAVEILERSPARLEHARALVNLGTGLRIRGQRNHARETLTQALDIAHRLHAVALADLARTELVATGARPRRHALSGPDSLTPAELRTARMAAEGHTNREIAQSLFVSTKTIEAQLSQAYSKLSISSRRELAGALGRAPAAGEPNVRG